MTEIQSPSPFNKASPCRSNEGFVVVLLLAFLPVLFTATLLVPMGLHAFQIHKAERHICRTGLLSYQASALQTIEQLKLLNIEARVLRAQKVTAQAMMLVPKTAVPGLKLYLQTRRAQKILDTRQRLLLNLGRIRLQKQLWQIVRSLKKTGTDFALFTTTTQVLSGLRGKLAVRPDDSSDIAPVYVLEDDFTHKQTQQISWKTSLSFRGDFAWKEEIGWRRLRQNQACAATIENKDGTLRAVLSAARFWPSF